jgi:hypothetical protein
MFQFPFFCTIPPLLLRLDGITKQLPDRLTFLCRSTSAQPDAPLFISHADRTFNKDCLRALINRLGDRAEINKTCPRKFRQTFGTICLQLVPLSCEMFPKRVSMLPLWKLRSASAPYSG